MRTTRQAITRSLRATGFWDDTAIDVFLSFSEEGEDGTVDVRPDTLTEVRLIGSGLYRLMFTESALSPKDKALLPIRQMGGYVDRHHMLQLPAEEYRFSPALAPHDPFWGIYAACVREAFPSGLTGQEEDGTAMRLVHQFRMYIDRHNIRYIRRKYPKGDPFVGARGNLQHIRNDMDSLMAYNRDLMSAGYAPLYFGEPSRYHNKLHAGEVFERQVNDKIETADKHGEFILDRYTGRFVTQWDVLEEVDGEVQVPANPTVEQQRIILNSESFNYAPGKDHYLYDVAPAVEDPYSGLEYDYKKALKDSDLWTNVPLASYRETIKKSSYPAAKDPEAGPAARGKAAGGAALRAVAAGPPSLWGSLSPGKRRIVIRTTLGTATVSLLAYTIYRNGKRPR